MMPRVIDARHAGKYRVWLRFDDDLTGEIDLKDVLWGPVFEPLKDVAEFAKLRADPEADTVVWPNGADLAPEFLYDRLKATLARMFLKTSAGKVQKLALRKRAKGG